MSADQTLGVERSRGFSVLAVIAFVLSFLVTVAGVILGIVALVQIRRTHSRGGGLAIAAIILGGIFTIVWIVGGLAIIAGTVFIGQQNQAKDAATQSDLEIAKLAMISYATSNDGQYTTDASKLAGFGYTKSDATRTLTIEGGDSVGAFCIVATSTTGDTFHVTQSSGVDPGPCAP